MIRLPTPRTDRPHRWLLAIVAGGLLRRGVASTLAVVLLLAVGAAGLPYAWCASMRRASCCCHAPARGDTPVADRAPPGSDRVERSCCETRDTDALPVGTTASTVLQPQLATAAEAVILPGPEPMASPALGAPEALPQARAPPVRPRRAIERCIELQRFHC